MILKPDFNFKKYGMSAGLVTENDAPFIVSMRSDPERTQYMITLVPDVEQQKSWIRDYKERENRGNEYYFIYKDLKDKPVGVNRLSHINYELGSAKNSSTIKRKGPKGQAAAMLLIQSEIAFDTLKLSSIYCDIHKDNKKIYKYLNELGYRIFKKEGSFYYMILEKNNFWDSYKNFLKSQLPEFLI